MSFIALVFLGWFVSFVWLVYARGAQKLLACSVFLALLAMIIWIVLTPPVN